MMRLMGSSTTPAQFATKFVGKVVLACLLTAAFVYVSHTPVSPGGKIVRKEQLVARDPGTLGGLLLPVCGIIALAGFATQSKGIFALMASAKTPAQFAPKFFAMMVVACFLIGVAMHFSPAPDAQMGSNLLRRETSVAKVSPAGMWRLVAVLGSLAVAVVAVQFKGVLALMASAKTPAQFAPKFFGMFSLSCFTTAVIMHVSADPEMSTQSIDKLMRREPTVARVFPAEIWASSRGLLPAMCGLMALAAFAMQAKRALAQLIQTPDAKGTKVK